MKDKMYLIVILVISLALIVVAAYTFSIPALNVSEITSEENKIKQLDNWLNRLYSQGKFHGVVLLSVDGQVIFDKGYGFADINKKEALTSHSSFNLASVSKQFTAVGIILLKHQGKLSYSDELREFMPELSFYSGTVLSHKLS